MELRFDAMLYSNGATKILMPAISNVYGVRRIHNPVLRATGGTFAFCCLSLLTNFQKLSAVSNTDNIVHFY